MCSPDRPFRKSFLPATVDDLFCWELTITQDLGHPIAAKVQSALLWIFRGEEGFRILLGIITPFDLARGNAHSVACRHSANNPVLLPSVTWIKVVLRLV